MYPRRGPIADAAKQYCAFQRPCNQLYISILDLATRQRPFTFGNSRHFNPTVTQSTHQDLARLRQVSRLNYAYNESMPAFLQALIDKGSACGLPSDWHSCNRGGSTPRRSISRAC